MPAQVIFLTDLALGYLAAALFIATYVWPRLRAMNPFQAHRAIATFHSFRFFGLVFLLPGVTGVLPASFATVAAWGDFATGVLALLALLTARTRALFWLFAAAFNVVGVADLLIDYYDAVRIDLPSMAGQLGATYAIPIIYVPLLMMTHVVALYWLAKPQAKTLATPIA